VIVEQASDTKATELYVEVAERRRNFTFSAVEIPIGTVLTFVDDDTITCTVVDDRRVEYNGLTTSLSNAALEALKLKGKIWPSVAGPQMWMFGEETLSERRQRFETSQSDA
jgi:hypothetical protein